ncbi:MAG: carboxypeptidase M32 [bacterium]|nr:carboxypeptidase M32 [bacterium]
MNQSYEFYRERMAEIQALNSALSLLSWDQETLMPPRGLSARSTTRAALAGLVHDRATDPALGALLEELAGAGLDTTATANVRESLRDHRRAVLVPRDLVTELAETTTLAQQAWVEARSRNEWPLFAPLLGHIVGLKRREAEALGYRDEPYDALLDEFEPGARAADLARIFAEVRTALVPLVEAARRDPADRGEDLLRGDLPVAAQDALGRHILKDLGFDLEGGRLDVSAHPFSTQIAPGDVRLTTHYDAADLQKSLYSTIHEAGHGMYEQGLPAGQIGLPLGEAVSLGVHESQSRLWENQIGRSRAFMSYLLPLLRRHFPGRFDGVAPEQLDRAVNVVRPSAIRIEADEVTYTLHIVLRMELERALLRGEIDVADLPSLWNERMRADLGVTPADDAEGVLQDIHWSFGLFGYFPTYALGNLYAAELHLAAKRALPGLDDDVARGDFLPLLAWLRENIHRRGREFAPRELVRAATGREPGSGAYLDYLRAKFGALYAV